MGTLLPLGWILRHSTLPSRHVEIQKFDPQELSALTPEIIVSIVSSYPSCGGVGP